MNERRSENEIVYSEPLEEAKMQKRLLEDYKTQESNLRADKDRAQMLLSRAGLAHEARARLEAVVSSCDRSLSEINRNQKHTKEYIDRLINLHLSYKQALDDFEPTENH